MYPNLNLSYWHISSCLSWERDTIEDWKAECLIGISSNIRAVLLVLTSWCDAVRRGDWLFLGLILVSSRGNGVRLWMKMRMGMM